MRRRGLHGFLSTALTVALLAGCSTGKGTKDEAVPSKGPEGPTTPVTLKVGVNATVMNQDNFKKYFEEPMKKKNPNITLEYVEVPGNDDSPLVNMVGAGNTPDVFIVWYARLQALKDLNVLQNIEPLMKKFNLSKDFVEKEAWDTLTAFTGLNYAFGLPVYYNTAGLVYNKDLFDRAGIPYPIDGMTWEEVKELGVKLSRPQEGIGGLNNPEPIRMFMQVNLPFVDTKTNKAALQTDDWKDALSILEGINKAKISAGKFESGTLAMQVTHFNFIRNAARTPDLNWDVVTFPQNKKYPGVGQRIDGPVALITTASKNQDAAFQFLQAVVSPEAQTELTKDGSLTVLKDNKIKEAFGASEPGFKGKNMQALVKLKMPAAVPDYGTSTLTATKIVTEEFNKAMKEGIDLNTMLRSADERLNKLLDEVKR